MSKQEMVRLSKFLSLVLRHDPQKIGIELDPAGWVTVTELLGAMARHGTVITRDLPQNIIETSDKKRFAGAVHRIPKHC
jgi:putative RNA 2'-phosphotransferase